MRTRNPRVARGFTVVELVVVIVILGITAVMAGPRFFGTGAFAERGYHDEVVSALRYARAVAIGSGCPVRFTLDGAGYALTQQAALAGHCNAADTTWPVPVRLPDGQSVTGVAPAGVATTPALTTVFEASGATTMGADTPVTIGARTLILNAASGYVTTP